MLIKASMIRPLKHLTKFRSKLDHKGKDTPPKIAIVFTFCRLLDHFFQEPLSVHQMGESLDCILIRYVNALVISFQ